MSIDPAHAISLFSMDVLMSIKPAERALAATALCGIGKQFTLHRLALLNRWRSSFNLNPLLS